MAVNANVLRRPSANPLRRPSDRGLFTAAAVLFPLLVLAGYFKSYYFSAFFDVKPVANALVHAHGVVMTLWVLYFTAQVALVRTRNVRAHMTLGMVGVALAALVVVVGLATAYDAHLVRGSAPAGINPHGFFLIPLFDMLLFVAFFGGAVYYRRRPAEHKSLMLLTAINFSPAAVARLPVVQPEHMMAWAFGVPVLLALVCLGWHAAKHGRLNRVFAAGVVLLIASLPLRIALAGSQAWLELAARLAP